MVPKPTRAAAFQPYSTAGPTMKIVASDVRRAATRDLPRTDIAGSVVVAGDHRIGPRCVVGDRGEDAPGVGVAEPDRRVVAAAGELRAVAALEQVGFPPPLGHGPTVHRCPRQCESATRSESSSASAATVRGY